MCRHKLAQNIGSAGDGDGDGDYDYDLDSTPLRSAVDSINIRVGEDRGPRTEDGGTKPEIYGRRGECVGCYRRTRHRIGKCIIHTHAYVSAEMGDGDG